MNWVERHLEQHLVTLLFTNKVFSDASLIIVRRANLTRYWFPGNNSAVKASHATHILVVVVCVCV